MNNKFIITVTIIIILLHRDWRRIKDRDMKRGRDRKLIKRVSTDTAHSDQRIVKRHVGIKI